MILGSIIVTLEGLALDLSPVDELAALGERLGALAAAFSDDLAEHAVVNRKDDEWHNLMLSACTNKKLLEQIAQVRSAIHRYESLLVGEEVLVERSAEEHAEIARHLVLGHPWGAVVEVLKHEMAHQYVQEHLGVVDESAHGPAFRAVCEKLGIDGRAHGVPESPADASEQRILDRVAALIDAGELRGTRAETLTPIHATNLREAHRRLESGTTVGSWCWPAGERMRGGKRHPSKLSHACRRISRATAWPARLSCRNPPSASSCPRHAPLPPPGCLPACAWWWCPDRRRS